MVKGSALEHPAHPITLHIYFIPRIHTGVLGGGASETRTPPPPPPATHTPPPPSPVTRPPVTPPGRHGWSPHVSPGCYCSAHAAAAAAATAAALGTFGGTLAAGERGGDGQLMGWLQGLASDRRRRGEGAGGEARGAKEGGKSLTGEGQQGLTTVRRFSAG